MRLKNVTHLQTYSLTDHGLLLLELLSQLQSCLTYSGGVAGDKVLEFIISYYCPP